MNFLKMNEIDVLCEIIDMILSETNPADENETKSFLKDLSRGNDYEKRLLICIGIDLKNKLIDRKVVKKILDSIDYDACRECLHNNSCVRSNCPNYNITVQCKRRLEQYESASVNVLPFEGSVSDNSQQLNVRFARVMNAQVFTDFYYNKYNIDDNYLDNRRQLIDLIEDGKLKHFQMPNLAVPKDKRKLVWTVPIDDIYNVKKNLTNRNSKEELANEIVNRLGLMTNDEYYICIEYDSKFNETVFQPSHLSTKWTVEHFYVSYKKEDGFGRTRPKTGDEENLRMREKVHFEIKDNSKYKYNIEHLGIVSNSESRNTDNFFYESIERYLS